MPTIRFCFYVTKPAAKWFITVPDEITLVSVPVWYQIADPILNGPLGPVWPDARSIDTHPFPSAWFKRIAYSVKL